ncbi:glycosyltransferase family 25 protein [Shinella pollutisoli]|uniref:Glycosyltransferase family 25 protein n=1 Tax=Shinella pollutisoli TaxID=2250594 RepID=A0ABV7DGK2_9HYPH|nr:glycosyltransferase family 25 protein [Shinella pollutisoli]
MWPIYVINLDRVPARLAESRARLDAAGLAFRRVRAVDGRMLTEDQLRRVGAPRPRFAKRPVTPAEVACFLSHRKAWAEIAAGDAPVAVVLEDDFVLEPGAARILERLARLPCTWDMLKLYSDGARPMVEAVPLAGGYRIGTPLVLPPTTVAYAITRPAARALTALPPSIAWPIDLYLKRWWEHGASIKVVEPAVVRPDERHGLTSSIDESRRRMRANVVLRFLRNAAYQLDFRYRMHRYAAMRATRPRWPETEPEGSGGA